MAIAAIAIAQRIKALYVEPMTAVVQLPAPAAARPPIRRRLRAAAQLAFLATIGGVALGEACYRGMQGGSSIAAQWAAVLADLGSPWVLTAFMTGAAIAAVAERRWLRPTTAGAFGGAWALVVATTAYYRLGPDRFVDRIQTYIGFWLLVGLAVGFAAGAAGAWWWQERDRTASLVPLVAMASLVSGEALFTWIAGYYSSTASLSGLLALLIAAGPTAAALLAPHPVRFRAVVSVLVLAPPATLALHQMNQVYRIIL